MKERGKRAEGEISKGDREVNKSYRAIKEVFSFFMSVCRRAGWMEER